VFISSGVAPVVVDECGEILQLEGDKGVWRGRLIEKNGGLGRRSPTKADDGAVRAKSHVCWLPPIAGGGQEVRGVLGELVWSGKMREKWGKERGAVATATVLNRRAKVEDDRWGCATRQARAERERERSRPTGGRGRRGAALPQGRSNKGGGRGADRCVAAIVPGGGTH
jgi:hypothetical protein